LEDARTHLEHVDGVMLGRVAYQEPYRLAEIDAALSAARRRHAMMWWRRCCLHRAAHGGRAPLKAITRHMLGLFQGLPGARRWRRVLSEDAHKPGSGPELVRRAAGAFRGLGGSGG